MPIRWRLAGGSAALTCVILASFAVIVGVLTDRQIQRQYNDGVKNAADQLERDLNGKMRFTHGVTPNLNCKGIPVHLKDYASAAHAQIRIIDAANAETLCDQRQLNVRGDKARNIGPQFDVPADAGTTTQQGFRVEARWVDLKKTTSKPPARVMLLYASPISDVDHTLARVQFFLLLGVLGGTALALLAGLATAQRAMRPVVQLTEAAREIERTRDPSRRMPHPEAEDEVADLARTLEGMLAALDAARGQTEAMLDRQREFVADASHELRTPLTSVLANLELLVEELDGEQADSALSALRATKRMRRLVGDLLLLARADAKRAPEQRPTDLAEVLTEAAAELGPLAEAHDLRIHAEPAVVPGVRDDLHRMVLNLLENAVQHTPPGTQIRAGTISDGVTARVVVEDDGPGIDPAIQVRVFERFVRGAGDGGRGSGLGLAIVRAVAESHGGEVILARPRHSGGTRFEIRLPQRPAPVTVPAHAPRQSARNGRGGRRQTSTTTGSTIGRRRNRS